MVPYIRSFAPYQIENTLDTHFLGLPICSNYRQDFYTQDAEKYLKNVFKNLNEYDEIKYGLHSLRSGGATACRLHDAAANNRNVTESVCVRKC